MSPRLLPCPAKSPDMNCIENAWGELVRAMYSDGRQNETFSDLKESLFYEWDKMSQDYIRTLVSSTARRV